MNSFDIEELTIPIPIIQGGMGVGISLSGLASAVANMGGIGVISSVGLGLIYKNNNERTNYKKSSIEGIRNEIRKARERTNGVLGVNIMSVITNFADMVRTSIEEKIDIIFAGAGLPLDLPKYLPEHSKTKLVPIVSSSRAASLISNKWKQNFDYLPDAFVVEGPKAGGHLGFKPAALEDENNRLENLVDNVLEVTAEMKAKYGKNIPVIAAGGIYSGADMHQFIEQGASAVQLGTRFAATEECDASKEFKDAFVNAGEEDIQIIKSPVGMPGRALHNKYLEDASEGKRRPKVCRHHCIKSCDPKTTTYCIAEALLAASRGELDDGFVFTGANAGKVKKISTVREVFQQIKNEYLQATKKKAASFEPYT